MVHLPPKTNKDELEKEQEVYDEPNEEEGLESLKEEKENSTSNFKEIQ